MAYTDRIDHSVQEVRGLLTAMKLEKKIKIAFDEWNLRSWHHPNVHTIRQGVHKDEYITPRDKNDDNSQYTMADAVFTACFLNAMNRNCDIVRMANFAPIVNTRGCIYTHREGIVLRSTYHVFDLYVNYLGDTIVDCWQDETPVLQVSHKNGAAVETSALDILATKWSDRAGMALAVVNKEPEKEHSFTLALPGNYTEAVLYSISGKTKDSYNDVGRTEVEIQKKELGAFRNGMELTVKPHSVNILQLL